MEKITALAEHLECEADDLTEETESRFSCGNQEYDVYTDEEANEALVENVRESLWAFNAEFILSYAGGEYDDKTIEALREMQSKLCESANSLVLNMIGGKKNLDDFAQQAASVDGRGHFLSHYDGNEYEVDEYFIYRTN